MASDMVVALGPATVGGTTLVGINRHGPTRQRVMVSRYAGRSCSPDETLPIPQVRLPQARQVFTVLGCQPAGAWGFTHGFNEHHVVVGCAGWRSKLESDTAGLLGTDLVRLVLERSHTAQHAVEVLTELIGRHGQASFFLREGEGEFDQIFLLADGEEAYVVEAAGRFWAVQECHQVRAVSDVALIRQDWCRLAPGLAEHAICQNLWLDDGSKLDFAGRLAALAPHQPFALKRWGRSTMLLEQQNGHLDGEGIRRLLIEHFEDTVVKRRPFPNQPAPQLHNTFLVQVSPRATDVTLAWVGLGPVGNDLFFPVFLEGELPALLERGPLGGILTRHPAWMSEAEGRDWQEELGRLQMRLDQEAEALVVDLTTLKRQGNTEVLFRQASAFMQAQAELLDQAGTAETRKPHSWLRQSDLAFVAE